MLELYENIKKRRKEIGMTQSELAEALGYYDKSMICKIEHGTINLPQSRILAIADALHTTASDLMGDTECATELESELFKIFNNLTDEGQEELVKYARLLKGSEQYKRFGKNKNTEK